MTTTQALRMTARDVERDARELEEALSTIQFLNEHADVVPGVDIQFPGFASDGAKAAKQLEHFRARRKELEDRWD